MTANEVLAPVEALAGSRETNGANDTPVNKHYLAVGSAYCGYTVRYAFEMSGNGAALEKCPSTAWVPTFRNFAAQYWTRVDNAAAQKGDVFFYKTQHTGFIYAPYDGRTVITLEGNADVYATAQEAEWSSTGSGSFEGIGYKKRYLSDDFRVYRPPYSGESKPESVRKVGVDVSYWNGPNVDWVKAKAAGIDFAIIRAGYGKGNIDSTAEGNVKRAKAAGVHIGFYWFSYASTAAEARAEADYCCDAIEKWGVKPDYPVCFDYEYDSEQKNPPRESIVDIARAFLARVKERGYYPANYTNIDYLDRGFDELTSEYDTWLAQWGVSKPGRDCTIWQYTSMGRPDGFTGNVDMNQCFVDYPKIISGNTPSPEPDPTPEPKEEKCMVECVVIKKGSSGSAVTSWQTLLNCWGYDCGVVDGIFGDKTDAATKRFQSDYKLTPDGIVGALTWGTMLA